MAKNTIKFLIILGVILLWLPSGISDLWIIPFIIDKIGMTMYIIISIIMVLYLYRTIEGKTLNSKFNNVKREIKRFI